MAFELAAIQSLKQVAYRSRRQGNTEEESLNCGAALLRDHIELGLGLYAFRCGRHAKTLAETDNGFYDREAVRPGRVLHEGLIDLDLVERETAQIAERRIPRAKIIHGDFYPQLLELHQDLQRQFVVSQEDRFGDFQLQPPRS